MLKKEHAPVLTMRPSENKEEVALAMEWAIQEGWNIGKYDTEAYYSTFPKGCQLLLLNEKPIGAIFLAHYDTDFVFIGLFIMDKAYRGKGYGKELWDYAMQQVQHKRSVALYAVPGQVSRYTKSNFSTAYDIHRWQTQQSECTSSSSILNEGVNSNLDAVEASNMPLINDLNRYESHFFPPPRFDLLKALLKSPQAVGFVVKESGQIAGFGMMRACQNGYRIGPLYANSFEGAKSLTMKLLRMANEVNATVIVDTPSPATNKFIAAFAEYFNLQRIEEADTQAMFKGEVPEALAAAFEKTYAACSLELG